MSPRGRTFLVFLLLGFPGLGGLAAEEQAMTLSGRMDSSLNGLLPNPAGGEPTALGLTLGYLGFSGGSHQVKSEVRVGFTTYPTPALSLDRAWLKFRFSGVRGTLGLGRIGWGPGFVYVPGDLLFDSTSLAVSLTNDELRSSGSWLGDLYLSGGDEAFAEAMVLNPEPQTITTNGVSGPFPGPATHLAGGLRVSAAPGGVTWEGAWAVDGAHNLQKAALSTQFHGGLDWYATLREDLPLTSVSLSSVEAGASAGFGAFGLFDLGEGFHLTTHHEALVRPWHHWDGLDLRSLGSGAGRDPDSPSGTAGSGLPYALYTYHDLSLLLPENWTLVTRALLSPVDGSGLTMTEVDWSPLQALRLYLRAAVQFGSDGATYVWNRAGSISIGLGAASSW